ncbi:carbohydrate ABC transporter permease [Nonomuraea sp. NPDC049480]|uniref:carbohydrate ABC transporter permease n=1 Tax=Nonomuraea sp. NPDC049480 TaxID=3364353 RepID=UPI0037AB8EB4
MSLTHARGRPKRSVTYMRDRPRRWPNRPADRRKAEARTGRLFTAPAMFLLLIFLIIPIALALSLGFTDAKLSSPQPTRWVGLSNFEELLSIKKVTLDDARVRELAGPEGTVRTALRSLTKNGSGTPYEGMSVLSDSVAADGKSGSFWLAGDPLFWKSLRNTAVFALVVVPVQGGLGLLLALLVNSKFRGRVFFRTVFFLPVVMSMVVVSILWAFIYQEDGLVNNAIKAVYPSWDPVAFLADPSTALPAIVVMSIWQAVGFHMIIWLAGLQTIPGELYEAAKMDGAGPWRTFTSVTWPGLRHTFVFVLVTITISALGLFTQINVMTKGGPLDSTSTLVYQAFAEGYGKQRIGYASAISFVFFVLVLCVALIQRRLTREKDA